jgi:transglutaminase-like putative cysteine protease
MNTIAAIRASGLTVLLGAVSVAGFAQAPSAPAPGTSPPPVTINVATEDITVGKDGLYTQVSHYEITPSNDSVAKSLGQQTFAYSEATDDLQVTEAYTRKSDGTKVPVDPTHIFVQSPQGSSQAPMFDDIRHKVVVFPDLSANDTIVYTVTKHAKETQFPGQFLYVALYSRLAAWKDAHVTITAPKSLPLIIENHETPEAQQVQGDNVVYRWNYAAPVPLTEEVAAIAPVDREPRFFASTFKSYDDLGHAFAALALPKAAVTPKVKALADETTAGVTERRAQAQKLYEWVSRHIRYVGIELGNGRIVPHEADVVIANGYGDCKDHAVLFAALLQAKGIASEMVLINAGASYALPDAPTLAQFNHAITWIPELKLYADTTAAVAPFGTLPFVEYGKPVVHGVLRGPTRHTVPLLAPGDATMSLKTVSQVTPDGGLNSQVAISASGPFSVMLRQTGMAIEAAGSDRAVKGLLQRAGMTGSGAIDFGAPQADLAPGYTIKAHLEAQPQVPFTSGQGFPIPPGLRLLPSAGDYLVGPLYARNLPATEPTPCWSGTAVEELSIEPPPGKHFAKLPQDVTVTTDSLNFTAHWVQADRIISVRREFTSKMTQALCSAALRKAVADALPKIAAAYPMQISLVDD